MGTKTHLSPILKQPIVRDRQPIGPKSDDGSGRVFHASFELGNILQIPTNPSNRNGLRLADAMHVDDGWQPRAWQRAAEPSPVSQRYRVFVAQHRRWHIRAEPKADARPAMVKAAQPGQLRRIPRWNRPAGRAAHRYAQGGKVMPPAAIGPTAVTGHGLSGPVGEAPCGHRPPKRKRPPAKGGR